VVGGKFCVLSRNLSENRFTPRNKCGAGFFRIALLEFVMSKFAGRRKLPKQSKKVLATEIAAFLIVVLIALDELLHSGGAHLWIGIVLGLSAIAGACGYLIESRKKSQP
jgi:hypothetical protein